MPKWELFGRETFTMEGDPAIPVIADTWQKGIRDFDIDAAYAAFVKSATTPGKDNLMRPDIDPYLEKGYVPLGMYAADFSGDNSVSHALEYYIADYALSLLSEELGHVEDAERFLAQSLKYKQYYCPDYGTFRPILKDGTFLEPFNPRQGENFEPVPGFHEGSAWNYTFYVPHDVEGLAKLMGGKKPLSRSSRRCLTRDYTTLRTSRTLPIHIFSVISRARNGGHRRPSMNCSTNTTQTVRTASRAMTTPEQCPHGRYSL